jgi:transposase
MRCRLIKIGEDVSEQLDVEPARFFVHRHIRPQYACRTCETITAAPVAPALIDGGLAAPGLHAWVLIQKYLDHLPLYRIEKISERHGVGIARSTLAQWVGQLGVALQPLVDRLSELLKQGKVLHADETPVQQLDPGKGANETGLYVGLPQQRSGTRAAHRRLRLPDQSQRSACTQFPGGMAWRPDGR